MTGQAAAVAKIKVTQPVVTNTSLSHPSHQPQSAAMVQAQQSQFLAPIGQHLQQTQSHSNSQFTTPATSAPITQSQTLGSSTQSNLVSSYLTAFQEPSLRTKSRHHYTFQLLGRNKSVEHVSHKYAV